MRGRVERTWRAPVRFGATFRGTWWRRRWWSMAMQVVDEQRVSIHERTSFQVFGGRATENEAGT